MLVRVHSLYLLTALVASGDLATAIPFESSSSIVARDMPRPRFGNVPYGVDITHCTVKGKVALSFDDGPGEYTEKVLDTLEKNGNIKATFFLVGTNGNNGMVNSAFHPLLKRMFDAGHQLASHSWSHKDFNTISHDQRVEELVKNEEAFANILNVVPTYFRPPYTHCDDGCISTLNDLSYHVTDYNLDTKDWVDGGANSKATYADAVNKGNPSSDSFIALSHDIHPFTVNGFVQYMIDVAKEKGFEFTTIGECVGDPVSNWYRDPKTGEPWKGSKDDSKPSSTSKPTAPSTTSAAPSTSATKEATTTASGTESAKPTAKTATEDDKETETATATTVKPPSASATVDGGANVGLGPATPTGTNGSTAPTATPTTVEVNAAGRAVFSVAGAVAVALAWAMMI